MEATFCTLGVESLKNNLFWLYPRFLSSIEFSRVLPWRVPGYNSSTHLTSGEKAFPDIKKFLIRLIRIFSNRIYTTYSMCVPLHKVRYVWTYIVYSMYHLIQTSFPPSSSSSPPPSKSAPLTLEARRASQWAYNSLNTPSIIYFWKPQAKSSSMKMTPSIMITIRNLRRMEDVLQVQGGSWQLFFT